MVFTGSDHTKLPMTRLKRAGFAPRVASALALAAIAAACPVRGAAWAQDNLLDRIFGGSERLGGGGGDRGAPAAGPDRAGTVPPSGPDLLVRLDRLEAQIRQLTGVIEQLQYRNQQLEAVVRRMQEAGVAGAPQPRPQALPPTPGPAAAATASPGRRGDAFDPAQNPSAPGAPHTLGSMGQAPMGAEGGPVGAPGGRGAGSPLDIATMSPQNNALPPPSARSANAGGAVTATLPPSQTPRDEFDLAYGYVLRKDYALAEDGFRSFLSKYPGDRLAGDATYWFGESLFQRQQYRDAAEAFLNVSTKFESNAKAPDALLRLGQSLAALGEKEAACASLGEVLRKFPRASAGVKQGVEREQKRVRC
jgi:tol-pal system protein YbgF